MPSDEWRRPGRNHDREGFERQLEREKALDHAANVFLARAASKAARKKSRRQCCDSKRGKGPHKPGCINNSTGGSSHES